MRLVESPSARVEGKKHRLDRMLLLALMGLPLLISLGAYWVFNHGSAGLSVFTLTNLVGPTTESLLKGGGLTACTDELGTPGNPICFHGGRMPLPTLVVALGVKLFGNHFLPVALLKMLLLLIPVELGLYLVWRRLALSNIRKILMTLLLLVPFGITAFIADVVNLQVEEGYSYGFLVLAVAILFFAMDGAAKERLEAARGEWLLCLLFAISVDGVYLAKSSMVVVCFVLVGAFLLKECRLRLRGLVLVLVVAAPLGWALHQHYASGRYSIGTSIDGLEPAQGKQCGVSGSVSGRCGSHVGSIRFGVECWAPLCGRVELQPVPSECCDLVCPCASRGDGAGGSAEAWGGFRHREETGVKREPGCAVEGGDGRDVGVPVAAVECDRVRCLWADPAQAPQGSPPAHLGRERGDLPGSGGGLCAALCAGVRIQSPRKCSDLSDGLAGLLDAGG
jgi:hypothetical protein